MIEQHYIQKLKKTIEWEKNQTQQFKEEVIKHKFQPPNFQSPGRGGTGKSQQKH